MFSQKVSPKIKRLRNTYLKSKEKPKKIETIKFKNSGKRLDGLPDWVWSAEGFEFSGFVPSCYDPTYCETDPPVPDLKNANYKIPAAGSLRYKDGEVITYTCNNPSK